MVNESIYMLGAQPNKIRELFEYGKERAEVCGEENVFNYSIGNPSVPAPAALNETAIKLLREMDSIAVHGYTSSIGDRETREAIAEDLNARFDCGARAGNFFLTCGAAPALTAVMHALAVPEAEIMVVAPYFMEYKVFAEAAGEKVVVVEADIPDFQIRLDEMERLLTPHTQAVILNSPNNPAGTIYTRKTLEALSELLTRKSEEFGHPIYIIADEPYRELVYGGVELPFIPNIYPNTVVCYSFSKCLSIPGERLGYVYIPDSCTDSKKLYKAVAGASRSLGHVCAPSLWQKVIAKCVHLRPDLESYDRNRRALYEALTGMGYRVAKPDGAFYLFIEAPNGDGGAYSDMAKEYNLLVVPGAGFGCPSYFRVCYAALSYDMLLRSLPAFKAMYERTKQ